MKLFKRHILKSVTWRVIGSLDTLFLAWLFSGDFNFSLQISGYELISKTILYYTHERIWFHSSLKNSKRRHFIKTLSWRIIGTVDTIILSLLVIGNPLTSFKIGGAETLTKMILYYLHERIWYSFDFGLNEFRSNKINTYGK